MNLDDPSPGKQRRQVKFNPKPPSRRAPQLAKPKTVVANNDEEGKKNLLRRLSDRGKKLSPKVEKNAPVQVAFGYGAASSSIRTYGGKSSGLALNESTSYEEQSIIHFSAQSAKIKKEYREPWDYQHSYYPTTLPLRRPFSGDPELLNEEEFHEDSTNLESDESNINPALELGLLKKRKKEEMFFFQFPAELPLSKRSTSVKRKEIVEVSAKGKEIVEISAKGKEMVENSASKGVVGSSKKGCSLEELTKGHMGKMLVYKSGAIKLKLGETLYDVSPGSDCLFAQEAVAIDIEKKKCQSLGEIRKRIVVTPDFDSLLHDVGKI